MQTPCPLSAFFVHPSWLQLGTFAPCFTQTPPFTTILVHPSSLQVLTFGFAPCPQQTPPFFACLVHPSSLHFALTRFAELLSATVGGRFRLDSIFFDFFEQIRSPSFSTGGELTPFDFDKGGTVLSTIGLFDRGEHVVGMM